MYLRQESVIWVYTNKPGYSERDSLGRRDLNPRVTRLRFLLLIRQRRYIPMFPRPSDGGWITPTVILVLLTTNFALREGLEPSTFGLTVRCSDQLSYRRMVNHVEGKVGLEPTLFQYFQSRVNSPPLNQFSYSPKISRGNCALLRGAPGIEMEVGFEPTRVGNKRFCRPSLSTTQPLHQIPIRQRTIKKPDYLVDVGFSLC